MKKFIAILIILCLLVTPINVFAVSADESEIFSKDNISLTPYEKTPEEQAIEKILATKERWVRTLLMLPVPKCKGLMTAVYIT